MPRGIRKELGAGTLPQYIQVANSIVQKIHDGEYRPGHKMPSMRELASEHGVSLQVIVSAIELLSARNYINSEPKRGLFVNWKIKSGRYYHIGVFVNGYNPVMQSLVLHNLLCAARKYDYGLLLGTNFENTSSICDWLDSRNDLDGLVIIGIIGEQDVAPLLKRKFPYIVMGNHPISPKHPQYTIPLMERTHKIFLPILRQLRGKRIAAIMGSKKSKPDHQVIEGIRRAIVDSGSVLEEKLLRFSGGDAFKEITELLQTESPDVLYLPRLQQRGYAKYLEAYPDAKRPFVICPENSHHLLKNSEISAMISYPNTDREDAEQTVAMLMQEIEKADNIAKSKTKR